MTTTVPSRASEPGRAGPPDPVGGSGPGPVTPSRWLLPVVLTGVFMATLDAFIVNVAIPAMQQELHTTAAQVEWVVAGYGLTYGALMITGGRLGDHFGRRRMFVLGMALFTLASAACGLATGGGPLIGGRVVQGAAAALLAPQVLALLNTAFTGTARTRAFTAWGVTMGLAAVFGQLIGGALIRVDLLGLGWRSCFLINIPVGALAIALAFRHVPESRSTVRARLDLAGMLLITLALAAVVLPMIEGREEGWPLWTRLSLVVAGLLFVLFTAHQRRLHRQGRAPLIHLPLFRERAFTAGLVAQAAVFMGQASFFLVLTLYLQQGRGLEPIDAGLVIGLIGVGYMGASLLSARVARRLGRQVLAVGAITMAAGLAVFSAMVADQGTGGPLGRLLIPLFAEGVGMGLVLAPLTSTVLARVTPHHAGAASGVLSTVAQVANALGVAVIGMLFFAALGDTGPGAGDYRLATHHALNGLVAVELIVVLAVQSLPRAAANRPA